MEFEPCPRTFRLPPLHLFVQLTTGDIAQPVRAYESNEHYPSRPIDSNPSDPSLRLTPGQALQRNTFSWRLAPLGTGATRPSPAGDQVRS
jgi:hypothetical protein